MVVTDFSIPVIMRDGINLSTIVVKPDNNDSFPVFLVRTPYSAKSNFLVAKIITEKFNSVTVLQDCRGRYDSDGHFKVCDESKDTIDTINWIKEQNWFNGDLHIFGPSYLGYVGLQVLDEDIKIKTIFAPTVLGGLKYSIHRGDVLQYHWALPWSIMTSTRVQSSLKFINGTWPEAYNLAIEKPMGELVKILGWPDQIWRFFNTPIEDSLWKKYDVGGEKPLNTKICLVGAWYDFLLNSTLKTYDDLTKRGGIKPDLIIGPWSHNGYLTSQAGVEEWEFGIEGTGNFIKDLHDFLQREQNKAPQLIRVFILRSNKWIDLDSWLPSKTKEKKLYLQKNNILTDNYQENELVELSIEADINNPVPTLGGLVWESYYPLEPGPRDQKSLHDRTDLLLFYTQSLAEDLILLGPSSIDLWVKTKAAETHFTAKLVVVETDGTERIFQDGIQRVKGPINGYKKITIDLLSTGITLNKKEKLGLEISWSNFPKYALPSIKDSTKQYIAISKDTPSCLKLSTIKSL